MSPTRVRRILSSEIERLTPDLVDLLCGSVNDGAALGFLPPLLPESGRHYWLSLQEELVAGSRVLLGAFADDVLIGAGQLALPKWTAMRRRAEIQKLLVARASRGRGVERALMSALHDEALFRHRSLVVLITRRGDPTEQFCRGMGYREDAMVAGDPASERHDVLTLYQDLADPIGTFRPDLVAPRPG